MTKWKHFFPIKKLQEGYTEISRIFTGLPYGNPSRKMGRLLIFFLFSVLVKVLPVTPLVSGVFVHRALCAYFLRIERVVEMRRFLWWTQENH